jgi:hypothetical protein
LDRAKLGELFDDSEIDRLQDLLARRVSLCDDEPAELAEALDREIETLIGDRQSQLWELLQADTTPALTSDLDGGVSGR